MWLDADAYTPTDAEGIPTGEIAPVAGTALDFTKPKALGADIAQAPAGCYDNNFCLNGSGLRKVALVKGEKLSMEVETTTEGMQIYCANFTGYRPGKAGAVYHGPCFVCLEAQGYPDAMHHENFPSVLLAAGEEYRQTTIYRLF
jgi:aldose 1-epimerase